MYPCWDATPSCRPSFASLAASLGAQLGEEGVTEYEGRAANYAQRFDPSKSNTDAAHSSGPAPPGKFLKGKTAWEVGSGTDVLVKTRGSQRDVVYLG
jgi:hypothetical protein